MRNIAIYNGDIRFHPFVSLEDREGFEVLNPAEVLFSPGGRRWPRWTPEQIESDVLMRMTYATYKNFSNFAGWPTIDKTHPPNWIFHSRGKVLMDITYWGSKGKWDWTRGKRYLDAYLEAMEYTLANKPEGFKGYRIVDIEPLINSTRHLHEFYDTHRRITWEEEWQAFLVKAKALDTNIIIESFDTKNLGSDDHTFEADWLKLKNFRRVRTFIDRDTHVTLHTGKYENPVPGAGWRVTVNCSNTEARGIGPRSSKKRFCWDIWRRINGRYVKQV
jgi:hypothetical protein